MLRYVKIVKLCVCHMSDCLVAASCSHQFSSQCLIMQPGFPGSFNFSASVGVPLDPVGLEWLAQLHSPEWTKSAWNGFIHLQHLYSQSLATTSWQHAGESWWSLECIAQAFMETLNEVNHMAHMAHMTPRNKTASLLSSTPHPHSDVGPARGTFSRSPKLILEMFFQLSLYEVQRQI